MSIKRAERVGPLIHQEIAQVLIKKLDDPGLKRLTFTRVKMTSDLKLARIYFSVVGDQDIIDEASRALDRAKGVFKRAIGKNLSLRSLPELEFHHDQNLAHADRIEQILYEIKRDQAPDKEL